MAIGPEDWIHRHAAVNAVRLHYVECGSGPLVILLHGFPEYWYAWRHQIPALAAADFARHCPGSTRLPRIHTIPWWKKFNVD